MITVIIINKGIKWQGCPIFPIYTPEGVFFHLSVTWSAERVNFQSPSLNDIDYYFQNLFERCKKWKNKNNNSLDLTQWHSLCIGGKHMATTDSSAVPTIPTKCKHYALYKHNIYCTGRKKFSGPILAIANTGENHVHVPTRRPGLSCRNLPIGGGEGGRGARQQSLAFSVVCFQQCILKIRWNLGGGGEVSGGGRGGS